MKNRKPKYCKKANPTENSGRAIPTFLILAMISVILAFMARGCSKTGQPNPEAIPPHPIETTEFDSQYEYTLSARKYLYILIKEDKLNRDIKWLNVIIKKEEDTY